MARVSFVALGLLALANLALSGCSSGTAASRVEVDVAEGSVGVQPGDRYVDGRLEVEDVKTKIEGGILTWQVRFKNIVKDTVNAEYRAKYYDANGWELTTGMIGWKPLILVGLESVNQQGSCPVPGAVRFTFYFREVKPIGR